MVLCGDGGWGVYLLSMFCDFPFHGWRNENSMLTFHDLDNGACLDVQSSGGRIRLSIRSFPDLGDELDIRLDPQEAAALVEWLGGAVYCGHRIPAPADPRTTHSVNQSH